MSHALHRRRPAVVPRSFWIVAHAHLTRKSAHREVGDITTLFSMIPVVRCNRQPTLRVESFCHRDRIFL